MDKFMNLLLLRRLFCNSSRTQSSSTSPLKMRNKSIAKWTASSLEIKTAQPQRLCNMLKIAPRGDAEKRSVQHCQNKKKMGAKFKKFTKEVLLTKLMKLMKEGLHS